MNGMLEYLGYHARIELDTDDMIFVGTVFGINDSLSFHGKSIDELKTKFEECIDDYLLMCEQIGKDPDKEFRGSFNIRIDPELHKEIAYRAFENNHSMNKEIELAISEYLTPDKKQYKQFDSPSTFMFDFNTSFISGQTRNSSKAPSAPEWLDSIFVGG